MEGKWCRFTDPGSRVQPALELTARAVLGAFWLIDNEEFQLL